MSDPILKSVQSKYGAVAASDLSGDHAGVRAVAHAFGYSADELASIPAEANMGLSCGNPTAFAALRPGEVVVDLGSGGGLDVFLAAPLVGPAGKAIGIDMTPEMVERARANAAKAGLTNVEFHLATIDRLPLPDNSVDCIISNCVINLAPDKLAVFREMARVLKPGGRVAVSDIALKKPLPPQLGQDLMAYIGCIAGAIRIEDYQQWMRQAGFREVVVLDSGADLNAYSQVEGQSACCAPAPASAVASSCCSGTGCCSPGNSAATDDAAAAPQGADVHAGLADLLRQYDVNDYAASVKVYAIKR